MSTLNKKTVEDINVEGKKVLVRCDFNVKMEDGVVMCPLVQDMENQYGEMTNYLGLVQPENWTLRISSQKMWAFVLALT